MFCENCGNQISDKDMYCACCGAKINKRYAGPSQDQNYVTPEWEQIPPNDQWPSNQANPVRMNQPAPMPANKAAASSGIRNVYFVDFLCRLFSKENIPLCIYLVINMVIIGGIMSVLFVLPLQWGMLSGFFVYLATIVIALSPIGEFIVRFQTGCKKIKDPEIMSRLEPLFYEVYQKAKMQEPLISDSVRLYMNDDESENAFATGRNPKHSVICVTTGLLNKLDYYELEGVVAHELSHIKNYDIRLSAVVTVMVGFIVMLSDFVSRMLFWGGGSSDDNDSKGGNPILMIIGLICLILAPIFGNLMKLALSRRREYLADASAVELTRNPDGLISALEKISADPDELKTANKATANMYIVNPFRGEKKKKQSNIWSTHPATEDRIEAIRNLK